MFSWYVVTIDDMSFSLSVSPPGREPWQATIAWDSVIRVCFVAEGPLTSDGLYVFTSTRPESWAVPTEAVGGAQLLDELMRRGLFDAGLAVRALTSLEGLFCWPPDGERERTGPAEIA